MIDDNDDDCGEISGMNEWKRKPKYSDITWNHLGQMDYIIIKLNLVHIFTALCTCNQVLLS
jgi:hypothetical protein